MGFVAVVLPDVGMTACLEDPFTTDRHPFKGFFLELVPIDAFEGCVLVELLDAVETAFTGVEVFALTAVEPHIFDGLHLADVALEAIEYEILAFR